MIAQKRRRLFYRAIAKANYVSIGHCKLKGSLIVEERSDSMEYPRIVKINM